MRVAIGKWRIGFGHPVFCSAQLKEQSNPTDDIANDRQHLPESFIVKIYGSADNFSKLSSMNVVFWMRASFA